MRKLIVAKRYAIVVMMLLCVVCVALYSCDPAEEKGDNDISTSVLDEGGQGDVADTSASVGGFDTNNASNALFSVASAGSELKKVRFAKGNLQYQASTSTWRFADNQYDVIGVDNQNISAEYYGWIDLFGWGTSGWNSGAEAYQPYDTTCSTTAYWLGGQAYYDITGDYANADWGVYNAISNGGNQAGIWRTLTYDELNYILFGRQSSTVNGCANAHFVIARVDEHNGVILFPDQYVHPKCVALPEEINNANLAYSTNAYSISDWELMEEAGCVFLPATGMRKGVSYTNSNMLYYWTSTRYCDNAAGVLMTSNGVLGAIYLHTGYLVGRSDGKAVRLVRDVE